MKGTIMPNKSIIVMLLALLILIPACMQNVNSELLEAAKNGQTERVKDLLDAGADVDTKTADGFTALKWAVVRGYTGIVQVLLDAGADVDVRDNHGQTPLMLAAQEDHIEVVELLKEAGAKE